MNGLVVTPIYLGLTAILMAVLSSHVGILRGKFGVALGDGEQGPLALSIRRFGNLSEYAACVLLLLLVMEIKGVAPLWLHVYGSVFILLRLIHPLILFQDMAAPIWKKAGRFLAAGGTAALLVIGALNLLFF